MPVVRVYDLIPIPNDLGPQAYSCTFSEFVVVNSFDDVPEALRRKGFLMSDRSALMVSAIHQPDCRIVDGSAESKSFDHWCAEHTDWSKLPDWPAWSSLMATEPLGIH